MNTNETENVLVDVLSNWAYSITTGQGCPCCALVKSVNKHSGEHFPGCLYEAIGGHFQGTTKVVLTEVTDGWTLSAGEWESYVTRHGRTARGWSMYRPNPWEDAGRSTRYI